jgi:ABC-2 type transport system permease protein
MELKKQRMGVGAAELVIIILIILAVNYLSYKFFTRLDMTATKQYTISKASKGVLKKLSDPVTAEFYLSSDLPPQLITMRDEVKDKLAEYSAFSGGKLKLRYIDPGTDAAKKEKAESKGVREFQVNVVEKDEASVKNVFFGIALSYEDKTEAIPMANPDSLEYDLTSKLVKMTMDKKPKIAIFEGPMTFNQQQAPSYAAVQNLLGGANGMYEVVKVNPQSDKVLPEGLDGVIVLGAFGMTDAMKYSLDQFLMKGGKVIIAIDPMMKAGQQQGMAQDQAYPSLPTLEDQLQAYGIRITKQLIADQQCASVQMQGGMFVISQPYPLFPQIGPKGFNKDVAAVGKLESIIVPYCAPLDEIAVPDVKFTWLAQSSKESFTISSPFNLAPDQRWKYLSSSSTLKGPFNIAVMLDGKIPTAFAGGPPAPQAPPPAAPGEPAATPPPAFDAAAQVKIADPNARLVVMSSAAALADDLMRGSQGNMLYLNNLADMLLMGNDLLGIRSAPAAGHPMNTLTDGQKAFFRWANVLGVPVLLVLFGLLLWFLKGKRRQAIQARFAE